MVRDVVVMTSRESGLSLSSSHHPSVVEVTQQPRRKGVKKSSVEESRFQKKLVVTEGTEGERTHIDCLEGWFRHVSCHTKYVTAGVIWSDLFSSL